LERIIFEPVKDGFKNEILDAKFQIPNSSQIMFSNDQNVCLEFGRFEYGVYLEKAVEFSGALAKLGSIYYYQ